MSCLKIGLGNSLSTKSTGQTVSVKAAVYLQTSDIPNAPLAVEHGYFGDTKHYQKRSCLRPYLLGRSNKTYLKMSKNCSKRACSKGKNCLETPKEGDFGKKNSQNRLFTGASSYEINSESTIRSL